MRTCVHHGDSVDGGWYRCDIGRVPACYQPAQGPYAPCFVPLPAAAEEPEVKAPVGSWTCSCGYAMSLDRCRCAKCGASAPPMLEAPEQEKVPDSTPVTFAAILAYHRQRADDWRSADRPWHEEAVECLEGIRRAAEVGLRCHDCGYEFDDPRCDKADCPIWQARKAVEVEP